MLKLHPDTLSDEFPCSYLPDRIARYEYFWAKDLDEFELEDYLCTGWRKFGWYYFRPACPSCKECIPLRVHVREFEPSKSQRRIIRKNDKVNFKAGPLMPKEEIYEIFRDHSEDRFSNTATQEDFIMNFYQQSCPALQTEYFLNGRLMAVGYLDRSVRALSSVYFIFRTEYTSFSPGIFSILHEIDLTRNMDLEYYYLGYYIENNSRMTYKSRFYPSEKFLWDENTWVNFTGDASTIKKIL